jgi:hypothetical protein
MHVLGGRGVAGAGADLRQKTWAQRVMTGYAGGHRQMGQSSSPPSLRMPTSFSSSSGLHNRENETVDSQLEPGGAEGR